MDFDLCIKFYVLMLVMAVMGTGVAFFRKSYDLATCCYGFAMMFSIVFAMIDWLAPEQVGATVLSTTFDTYVALIMTSMCILCYKYDMRYKANLSRRIEAVRQENIKQQNDILCGVGVVDIAEGDVLVLSVLARNSERKLNGHVYTGFSAEAVGDHLHRLIVELDCRGIDIKNTREWITTLYVNDKDENLKETYTFVDGVWAKD